MAATAKKQKISSLEEYLLNSEVDLTLEKPRVMDREEGLVAASDAWTNNEAGIRAVLESRAMDLRHKILFSCQPVELPVLRERLKEVADIITLFKACSVEAKRRYEADDKDREAEAEAANEKPAVDGDDDKSSM